MNSQRGLAAAETQEPAPLRDGFEPMWGRFIWTIYAYCRMTNHDHLMVETPNSNLVAR
jgi:hypothetical protein